MLNVIEIFTSIEGEGKRAGLPAIFVRLEGCNLRCSYCDTKYSYDEEGRQNCKKMELDEVVQEIRKKGIKNVTITGGEPLIQEQVFDLAATLCTYNYHINIETNGTINVQDVRDAIDIIDTTGLFFTVDYKCPSSGSNNKMDINNFKDLMWCDVLKFVVGNREDLETAKKVIEEINTKAKIYFSPVFGEIEPKEIVQFLLENEMYNCRVQLQLHKFIWPPEQRGV